MKQTEIGLIPDDWEVKTLKEIFEFKPNNTFPRDCLNESKGEYQNVHYGDVLIKYPSILDCNKETIPFINEGINVKFSKYGIKEGDIIIADTAEDETVGKVVEVYNLGEKKLVSGLHTFLCRKITDDFAPKWLGYFMNQAIFHNQLLPFITGTKVSAISRSAIQNVKVLIPPLAEQQRIAKALSDVDALISTTEKLIQKKKNIKQGTMQNLLTGKKRLPGFGPQTKSPTYKQTELGPIPEDWEVKTLNELINDISDGPFGSNLKTEHYTTEREVRIIQLSNVGEDGWDNENVKYTTFTHAKEIQRCIVPYGSIVIAKMMPAGRSILCPNQEKMYILGSDCVRITPNSLLDSLFFMYFSKTSFYLNQIKENTQGSTRARTSVSKLKRIEIALPSKEEQTAIANVLSSMDNEIEILNTKLKKYRNLKTAMMQQLLTGKIRLR